MTRRRAEGGFTLIEMLITLSIIALLVRISLPGYSGIRRQAIAAQAAGDFNTIRAAAVSQYEATGSYAPDSPAGTVPAGMGSYLPGRFTFSRPAYELDWEHYLVSDTSSSGATSGQVLALTVVTADSLTGLQIVHALGSNCAHWSVGNAHTFVVFSTLEAVR
jgi:prepilin-type N-terminal cleavage/methylation domain-containing protein